MKFPSTPISSGGIEGSGGVGLLTGVVVVCVVLVVEPPPVVVVLDGVVPGSVPGGVGPSLGGAGVVVVGVVVVVEPPGAPGAPGDGVPPSPVVVVCCAPATPPADEPEPPADDPEPPDDAEPPAAPDPPAAPAPSGEPTTVCAARRSRRARGRCARSRAASRWAAASFAGEKALAGMSGATAVEPVTMNGPTCTVSVHLPWSCVRRWNHQLPGASAGLVTPLALPGRSRIASGSDRGAFVQLTE